MITIIAANYRGIGKASMVFFNGNNKKISDMPISAERLAELEKGGAIINYTLTF